MMRRVALVAVIAGLLPPGTGAAILLALAHSLKWGADLPVDVATIGTGILLVPRRLLGSLRRAAGRTFRGNRNLRPRHATSAWPVASRSAAAWCRFSGLAAACLSSAFSAACGGRCAEWRDAEGLAGGRALGPGDAISHGDAEGDRRRRSVPTTPAPRDSREEPRRSRGCTL